MARKVRIEYPGAVYHVMSRGDHQEAIYQEDGDREAFLRCLEQVCEKTGWVVHAYVLMGNHYHLLLETPNANLVTGMKWLQGTYTQRYNSRHRLRGHLFQGRYKSLPMDEDEGSNFQTVASYIHLNPVRAGLIRATGEPVSAHRWSSYPAYLVPPRKRPGWLRVERVLGSVGIGADDLQGRKGYEAYIEGRALECRANQPSATLEAEWKRIRRGWYLGDLGFKDRLLQRMGEVFVLRKADSVSGKEQQARSEAEVEPWITRALQRLGLDDAGLRALPKGADPKLVLAWGLRRRTTLSRRWIADRLGMGHETRITWAVREVAAARQGSLASLCHQIEGE